MLTNNMAEQADLLRRLNSLHVVSGQSRKLPKFFSFKNSDVLQAHYDLPDGKLIVEADDCTILRWTFQFTDGPQEILTGTGPRTTGVTRITHDMCVDVAGRGRYTATQVQFHHLRHVAAPNARARASEPSQTQVYDVIFVNTDGVNTSVSFHPPAIPLYEPNTRVVQKGGRFTIEKTGAGLRAALRAQRRADA